MEQKRNDEVLSPDFSVVVLESPLFKNGARAGVIREINRVVGTTPVQERIINLSAAEAKIYCRRYAGKWLDGFNVSLAVQRRELLSLPTKSQSTGNKHRVLDDIEKDISQECLFVAYYGEEINSRLSLMFGSSMPVRPLPEGLRESRYDRVFKERLRAMSTRIFLHFSKSTKTGIMDFGKYFPNLLDSELVAKPLAMAISHYSKQSVAV